MAVWHRFEALSKWPLIFQARYFFFESANVLEIWGKDSIVLARLLSIDNMDGFA
jgi:hypothetical protein